MGLITNLAAMEEFINGNSKPGRQKAEWLSLKDGETVKVYFLQELDQQAENFNPSAGTALLAVEHSPKADYRRKALCTLEEEGQCFGCEQYRKDPKLGYRPNGRLYINILVDNGKDEPFVAVLSQGTSSKTITPSLVMWAGENGSITDTAFRFKRSGTGTETEYSLVPIPKSVGAHVNDYTLYDLKKTAVKHVPYPEQMSFYTGTKEGSLPQSDEDTETSISAMEW